MEGADFLFVSAAVSVEEAVHAYIIGFRENESRVMVMSWGEGGEIRQHKPVIYQEVDGVRQAIAGGYRIEDQQHSFGRRNVHRTVTLDSQPRNHRHTQSAASRAIAPNRFSAGRVLST